MRTLPISDGWNDSPPKCTQRRAPLMVSPIPGAIGRSRNTMPASPTVYVYWSSVR